MATSVLRHLRSVVSIPTEHDWEDEEPITEEDAVKRMLKRTAALNGPGVLGDLWRMHQKCHKEVENGNMDHMPMNFVRYQKGEDEKTRELFYICKKCISDYLIAHPEAIDDVLILRGEPTKELKDFMRKRAEEAYKKEEASRMKDQKHIDEVLRSDQSCPTCGKPFNKHSEEDLKSCYKQFTDVKPPR